MRSFTPVLPLLLLVIISNIATAQTITTGTQGGGETAGVTTFDNTVVLTKPSGILLQSDATSSQSSGKQKFNLIYAPTPFFNGPASQPNYIDDVWSFGINTYGGASRLDQTKASMSLDFESKFFQSGTFGSEFHVSTNDTNGIQHRAFYMFLPHDGGAGSIISSATDQFDFGPYSGGGASAISIHTKDNGFLEFTSGGFLSYPLNNVKIARQLNAAGTSYILLPFIDNADIYNGSTPIYFHAPTPQRGVFPGSFATFQATTASNGNSLVTVQGPTVTGKLYDYNAVAYPTKDLIHNIQNNNPSTTANSKVTINTYGYTGGGGDPLISFGVLGQSDWSAGIDNSDSKKFKISNSTTLGTLDRLSIDTKGYVSVPGSMSIGTAANPQGLTLYDTQSKQPYCVTISGGEFVKTPGECSR